MLAQLGSVPTSQRERMTPSRAATFDMIRPATSMLGELIKLRHYFNIIRVRGFVLNGAPFADVVRYLSDPAVTISDRY